MSRSTESASGHPPTDTDRLFAARVLADLLHRIEVGNANAAAHPGPGRCTFLVSHAWVDDAAIRLVYTAPPSNRTWGLTRDTRESLINPSRWNDADDPAWYYYLLDLEENWPGESSRKFDENPDLIWWSGDPATDLPEKLSAIPDSRQYLPPTPDPSAIEHTPPTVNDPRRYADPNGPLPHEVRRSPE